MSSQGLYTRPIILLSENASGGVDSTLRPAAANPEKRLIQPPYRVDFSRNSELTWMLRIGQVIGSPSAWSLSVKFQYRQDHTSSWQYSTPAWHDLDTGMLASDVVGPATTAAVASNSSTLPLLLKWTIRNFPPGVRMVLTPTFTGGTNPGLRCSLIVHPKG